MTDLSTGIFLHRKNQKTTKHMVEIHILTDEIIEPFVKI